jgi:hypothetical protein
LGSDNTEDSKRLAILNSDEIKISKPDTLKKTKSKKDENTESPTLTQNAAILLDKMRKMVGPDEATNSRPIKNISTSMSLDSIGSLLFDSKSSLQLHTKGVKISNSNILQDHHNVQPASKKESQEKTKMEVEKTYPELDSITSNVVNKDNVVIISKKERKVSKENAQKSKDDKPIRAKTKSEKDTLVKVDICHDNVLHETNCKSGILELKNTDEKSTLSYPNVSGIDSRKIKTNLKR